MRILDWHRTGSSYICDPPVETTDIDSVFYVDQLPSADIMQLAGWDKCNMNLEDKQDYSVDPGFDESWVAYRMGPFNSIITTSKELYLKFFASTLLSKELNLTNKRDRVALFRMIKNQLPYHGPFKRTIP